jgi:hypothetical protein
MCRPPAAHHITVSGRPSSTAPRTMASLPRCTLIISFGLSSGRHDRRRHSGNIGLRVQLCGRVMRHEIRGAEDLPKREARKRAPAAHAGRPRACQCQRAPTRRGRPWVRRGGTRASSDITRPSCPRRASGSTSARDAPRAPACPILLSLFIQVVRRVARQEHCVRIAQARRIALLPALRCCCARTGSAPRAAQHEAELVLVSRDHLGHKQQAVQGYSHHTSQEHCVQRDNARTPHAHIRQLQARHGSTPTNCPHRAGPGGLAALCDTSVSSAAGQVHHPSRALFDSTMTVRVPKTVDASTCGVGPGRLAIKGKASKSSLSMTVGVC